ncbi:MAG TPA: RyR domain-containing protein [Caulobacteraceae bacterium]|nr:RyR domain-containing protein [Caulobacteraceae bacterium]
MVIAEADLGESVENALRAAARGKAGPGSAAIAVHLDDPAMAEGIHHIEGGVDLYAFSEAHAVARSIMLRHPPFLLAGLCGAPAVHVLILGFDGLGQELARDVALNAMALDLGRPRITVVDHDAAFVKRGFLHRHPEFPHICDLEVFGHLEEARFGVPAAAPARPTVCASYVCLRDSAVALAAAIGLRESAIRHDGIAGPIFTRLRSGGLMRPPGGVKTLQSLKLYGFGGLADSSAASRALLADPDAAAKAVHENYARIGGFSAGPWEQLPEDLRASNRRVVSHIPAKLATLGFDLESWLALPDDQRPWPPPLAPGAALFRDAAERTRLAVLEHERWMADRRLNGWRLGERRDNARKIHTDLVPFEDLSQAVKAFDYAVIDWLDAYLPRRPGGLERV